MNPAVSCIPGARISLDGQKNYHHADVIEQTYRFLTSLRKNSAVNKSKDLLQQPTGACVQKFTQIFMWSLLRALQICSGGTRKSQDAQVPDISKASLWLKEKKKPKKRTCEMQNISGFPLDVHEWMWQDAYECWWDEVGELRELLRDCSVVGRRKKKKNYQNPKL